MLANMLYRAVGARVEPQAVELAEANAAQLLAGSMVVVDAFDNIPSRQAVATAATALGLPCLHVALGGDGAYACGLWDGAYQIPAASPVGVDGCDYPLTRSLVLLCATAGAEVLVRYLLDGSRQGFDVTLRDLTLRLA